jgi:maltose-binding protein MalE
MKEEMMKKFVKIYSLALVSVIGLTACTGSNDQASRELITVNNRDTVIAVPPKAPVKTSEGRSYSVSNVVSENQEIDQNPPVKPTVTENQSIDDIEDLADPGPGDIMPMVE